MSKLFLLSVEEAKKIPQDILACGSWWWLRSPGCDADYAAGVNYCGRVSKSGYYVHYPYACVRPALYLRSDMSNFERTKKGYIKFGHKPNDKFIKWIDISTYVGFPCLLMKKLYEYHRFDKESNLYEASEIYKRLQELNYEFFTDEEKAIIEDFELQERNDKE